MLIRYHANSQNPPYSIVFHIRLSNNLQSARMNRPNEQIRIQELERENMELRKQLGFAPPTGPIMDTQTSYQRMIQYNEQLQKEAADLYQQLLDQFATYKQLTSVNLQCSFKQKYLNLLKKSQRGRR